MAGSFLFYDLETSGFSPRSARIMQFGGQRTDLELKPIGEPVNVTIKLTPDILPSPDAILVTGITPQQTISEGITEAEFLKYFYEQVLQPGMIFVGFNSVRFDDEFMRFLHWRNFYDPYEWHWKDSSSRWDLLDVVRMTRALRPAGIEWPFAPDGRPANRLEFLTKVNKLSHEAAHDALSDVLATIDVARLVRQKQPELFDYLLSMRGKKQVAELVQKGEPFVYTSGHYPGANLHTTVVVLLVKHPQEGSWLVYDLRHDPGAFLDMSVEQLAETWKFTKDPDAPPRLPVKTLKGNRCPAIAPLGVIKDTETQEQISLTVETITRHLAILKKHQTAFVTKILQTVKYLDDERARQQASLIDNQLTVDSRLYEGFIGDKDRQTMRSVRSTSPDKLSSLADNFQDERLKSLLPLYKARNYSASLTDEERKEWEAFCRHQLFEGGNQSRLAKYFARLEELAASKLTGQQQYLLEELQLYGQSIVPLD